jgi:ribosomal protein S18 acetylase RimI-like enzyme
MNEAGSGGSMAVNTGPTVSDLGDDQLGAAVWENLFALFRSMRALPGAELVEEEGICHHHAFPSNPMFKGAWRSRLASDERDQVVGRVTEWFARRDSPYTFWWADPVDLESGLGETLARHGFTVNVAGDPGMAAEIAAVSSRVEPPEGFRVERALDRKRLEDWRDVFAEGFGIPLFTGQAWVDATLTLGPESAPWQLYVGYLGRRPVATNMLFGGAGVAGLFAVGTLSGVRGRGIGSAITLAPLRDAEAMGYRYTVLFATELGYPVYRRLGYRPLNRRIARWLRWRV